MTPSIDIAPRTLSEVIDAPGADSRRDFICTAANAITRTEIITKAERLGRLLHDLGIGGHDVVTTLLPNSVDLVVALFAAILHGIPIAPLNPQLSDQELVDQMRDCDTQLLIANDVTHRVATRVLARHPVTWLTNDAPGVFRNVRYSGKSEHLSGRGSSVALDPATAVILYTSGSTGAPKGVQLSEESLLRNADGFARRMGLGADDRALVVLPLFHANALMTSLFVPTVTGGSLWVEPRFSASSFWLTVRRSRATYVSAVPTMFQRLLTRNGDRDAEPTTLRMAICGSAPRPADLLERFADTFSLPIYEGYGLTEATCCVTMNGPGDERPGSVGSPLPGVSVAVVADHNPPRPSFAVGEILVSGYSLMLGYLGRPVETHRILHNGLLRTGDLGYLDDGGYLHLSGRSKDVIIRGGENIDPREIEAVLRTHSAVHDAFVCGMPDADLGEIVVAAIEPDGGHGPIEEELQDHCRAHLAEFKVPAKFEYFTTLPTTASGKVSKAAILRRMTLASS